MKKLLLIAGGVVGYVLGTRAGRERYAKIKQGSSKIWNSGPVQAGVNEAEAAAKQAAAAAGDRISDAADTVKEKVGRHNDSDDSPGTVDDVTPVTPVKPVATQTGSAPQEGTE